MSQSVEGTARAQVNNYVYGGALRERDRDVYVDRECDREVAILLGRGNFVHLSEPRQQGKTSLVNRLKHLPALKGYCIIDVKASDFKPDHPDEWYRLIGGAIYTDVVAHSDVVPDTLPLRAPTGRHEWHSFLKNLAIFSRKDVVLVLDEVQAIKFDGSDHFYSVIRNTRDIDGSRVSFVLSGCFNPDELIADRAVSPFNTGNRVTLPDFTREEVLKLAEKGPWLAEVRESLAERVYYWTHGHPYITQYFLCHLASMGATSHEDVDVVKRQFERTDTSNLAPIGETLKDSRLKALFDRILKGEQVRFQAYLSDYPTQQLRLAGVIKMDEKGNCVVRNRIYQDIFGPRPDAFISYRREDWPLAGAIGKGLTAIGKSVFDDQSVRAGEQYPRMLEEAIESARSLVVVFTEGTVADLREQGNWVCREIVQAHKVGTRVIPVLIDNCPRLVADALPQSIQFLASTQSIRLRQDNATIALEEISESME